ncbi:MAG: MFS transporter [Candidatus Omnitrophica bacterium]|nr:MFS transporter [Candidatus Omnitrophota bacterium]MBU4487717.1 MFS transporter [Candidatus Omnitrophota bacterium]MCG2705257.1 MFS transporter [Candidatus Omnitrophota bacterium]
MVRFRDVLKNRNFLLLWIGQIISNFGDWLNNMALVALVYKKSPGSTVELAKLLFFIIIPVFIIGPIAGVYVDRWDKKKVMIMADIWRGLLVLLIPFFILRFTNFLPVYILVFLIFSITRFFLPSKMAIIPDVVPHNTLLIANTLSDTTRMISAFVALGIAGIIVDKIGAINSLYINAASYFISAIFIYNMAVKHTGAGFKDDMLRTKEALKHAIKKSVWTEIKEGIRFISNHKDMKFVVRTFFLLMAGLGAVSCVIIVFIQDAFGSATKDLSFLTMILGFGCFISAVLYGRFGQGIKKEVMILFSLCLTGLFIVAFALTTYFASYFLLSAAVMFLIGISVGPIIVSLNTMVHESIPQATRGRIFSSLEAIIHLAFLVFMVIAALFADKIGKLWVLTLCGIFFSVWGVAGLIKNMREA